MRTDVGWTARGYNREADSLPTGHFEDLEDQGTAESLTWFCCPKRRMRTRERRAQGACPTRARSSRFRVHDVIPHTMYFVDVLMFDFTSVQSTLSFPSFP